MEWNLVPPSALFTDLYDLTMAQAYHAEGLEQVAVFELGCRRLPPGRNYLVAAGADTVREFVASFGFSAADLEYLRSLGSFEPGFLARLAALRFTGEVFAVPEGTPVFAGEPLLQVVAPLIEAQLIETFALNQVHVQTMAASKAARVVAAAQGRPVVDFGSRRAHGADAALQVARATYLAGGAGTSNVLAGRRFGIPVFGTMAHSYVQAHEREDEAFAAFAALYPGSTLLVDTYDTLAGVHHVAALARRLGPAFRVGAIRLDSGDLGALARESRRILDAAGLAHVEIFASSGLDEYAIEALLAGGAPIAGFGVGTKLAVSEDAPDLDLTYKLVALDGADKLKLSAEKIIYPGRKQVFRQCNAAGEMSGDVIGRWEERLPGQPLLVPLWSASAPPAALSPAESLRRARVRLAAELPRLPATWRALAPAAAPYPVRYSDALRSRLAAAQAALGSPAFLRGGIS